MAASSSSEAEVSSMAAACWEEPAARVWLEEETSPEAAVTCWARRMIPAVADWIGRVNRPATTRQVIRAAHIE
ncbi:MAG TPA: hypothetical protein VJ417_08030, partial [Candidatus Glassbacteria bacterium]|nr:hypothetical protein [Candidatus Glassbacteria bacterium]